jgi:hypothetical protein
MKLWPGTEKIVLETVTILIATLGAAFIISKFPEAQRFVQRNSVTGPIF